MAAGEVAGAEVPVAEVLDTHSKTGAKPAMKLVADPLPTAPEPGRIYGQRPAVIWLTGPSGAGKSTIGAELLAELRRRERHVVMLDGDDVRVGLCSDLGFSPADRAENIRRIAEVARLMTCSGMIVIVTSISPFRQSRQEARALFADGEFFETHVDTPLEVAEQRDPKGLYRRARAGRIAQFTGIDSPYEPPEAPELRLETVGASPQQCAQTVIDALERAGILIS